ncbi:hypothetical protein Tco_0386547 [Tanacetum coccineum]
MGVRVNFTSQSTTAALSIENRSLFEGESEFEKLKIYLITLVSIRSDWEDLPWLFRSVENLNMMAEQNVPAQAPTRTDEQIVPRSQWLQIRKSNLLFDAQKIQKNPIFQISVDILRNTNFFRAFSASASVPAVYIQQFWNSMKYDEKTGVFHNEDGNPARANIKQALGSFKDGDGDGDTTYTYYEVMKDLIKVSKLPRILISCISSQVHKMAIHYNMIEDEDEPLDNEMACFLASKMVDYDTNSLLERWGNLGECWLQQLAVKAEICGIMEQLVDWSVSNDHVPPFVAPNLHHDKVIVNGIRLCLLKKGAVYRKLVRFIWFSASIDSYNPCIGSNRSSNYKADTKDLFFQSKINGEKILMGIDFQSAYLEMKDFEQPVRSLNYASSYSVEENVMDGSQSSIPVEFLEKFMFHKPVYYPVE